MADILPFVRMLTRSRDWSAAERARLRELGDRLATTASGIDVSYGRTDAGDPWCVVTDEEGEVLIHVARIAGRFVVHHAVDDTIEESGDLRTALHRVLGSQWQETPQPDIVVPIAIHGRRAQTLAALVIANAFFDETVGPASAAVQGIAADDAHDRPDAVADTLALMTVEEQAGLVDHGAKMRRFDVLAALETAAPHAASSAQHDVVPVGMGEEAAFHPSARQEATSGWIGEDTVAEFVAAVLRQGEWDSVLFGTAGDDLLEGSDGRDLIVGGAGDDVLNGGKGGDLLLGGSGDDLLDGGPAEAGVVDVLDGGAGNDRLVMGSTTIATGGDGADVFMMTPPTGETSVRLGVLLDYSSSAGDSLAFTPGTSVDVTSTIRIEDILAEAPDLAPAADMLMQPGYRIGFDFDGDSREDGHLLIVGEEPPTWVGPGTPWTGGDLPLSADIPVDPVDPNPPLI